MSAKKNNTNTSKIKKKDKEKFFLIKPKKNKIDQKFKLENLNYQLMTQEKQDHNFKTLNKLY